MAILDRNFSFVLATRRYLVFVGRIVTGEKTSADVNKTRGSRNAVSSVQVSFCVTVVNNYNSYNYSRSLLGSIFSVWIDISCIINVQIIYIYVQIIYKYMYKYIIYVQYIKICTDI